MPDPFLPLSSASRQYRIPVLYLLVVLVFADAIKTSGTEACRGTEGHVEILSFLIFIFLSVRPRISKRGRIRPSISRCQLVGRLVTRYLCSYRVIRLFVSIRPSFALFVDSIIRPSVRQLVRPTVFI